MKIQSAGMIHKDGRVTVHVCDFGIPRDTLAIDDSIVWVKPKPVESMWRVCENSLMDIVNGSALNRDRAFAEKWEVK